MILCHAEPKQTYEATRPPTLLPRTGGRPAGLTPLALGEACAAWPGQPGTIFQSGQARPPKNNILTKKTF